MDGVDRAVVRRQSLKERLRLKGLGCCGPNWGLGPTTISVRDDDDEEAEGPLSPQIEVNNVGQIGPVVNTPTPPCVGQSPAGSGMNLAAALAAERQFRAEVDTENEGAIVTPSPLRPNSNDDRSPTPLTAGTAPGTPGRVSLLRLLEETDGYDGETKKEEDGGGCDSVCCVCMGRKKGAAFIPCGHTFCRVCSRELWLNRGSCPLCNRLILEILDLY